MIRKITYNLEKLKNSSDEDLLVQIYEKACEFEDETFGEGWGNASLAMKEIFAVFILETEVYNGGFDQFFSNYGIEYGRLALAGLNRISAAAYIKILIKAISIFETQNQDFIKKRNHNFDPLDDDFYQLQGVNEYQVKYIRNNYELFIP